MLFLKQLLFISIILLANTSAYASVYQVNDIEVKFKKFNPQKIRSYAVDVASQRGFDKLLQNIIPQEYNYKEIVDSIDLKNSGLVTEFNITQEINVTGNYQAKFDILYNSKKIKELLQEKRIPFTQKTMGKVLLLPIQKDTNSSFLLFDESNIFRKELFTELSDSLLVEPIQTKADLQEITMYTPQKVLDDMHLTEINELSTKYNAEKALVVLAEQDLDYQNKYNITLKYVNFPNLTEDTFIVWGDNIQKIAKETSSKILNIWKTNNLIELNKPKRFISMINTKQSLQELNSLVDAIKSLSMVSSVKVNQLSLNNAFIQTDFYGTPSEFLKQATQNNLKVYQSENGQWVIERMAD